MEKPERDPYFRDVAYGWVHIPTAVIGFDPSSYTVSLGEDTIAVTVTHTGGAAKAVQVQWTTDIGTTGTLTWARGDLTPRTITLDAWDETAFSRTFEVTLHDPVNAVLSVPVASVELLAQHLTSQPYPVEVIEGVESPQASMVDGLIYVSSYTAEPEAFDSPQATLVDGELRTILKQYLMLPEALDTPQALLVDGELRTILQQYSMLPEAFDTPQAALIAGELDAVLIQYTNWPAEAFDTPQAALVSGSLT